MRGLGDAYKNAVFLGLPEMFSGTNLSDYKDPYDQEAYLRGRLAGDAFAMGQSVTEIEGGAGGGASLSLATGGTSLIAGGAVAAHGAGVGLVATSDAAWVTAKLIKLKLYMKTADETSAAQDNSSNVSSKRQIAPQNWIVKPSKKGGGTVYQDPTNPHNIIREMPGNSTSPSPAQQKPYIKFMKEGKFYDVNGNPLKNGDLPDAHIPADKFDLNKMPKF